MCSRGFSLVEVMIAVGVVAILVLGGFFLFSGNEDGESYIEERLDTIEKAEEAKKLLENENKAIRNELLEDESTQIEIIEYVASDIGIKFSYPKSWGSVVKVHEASKSQFLALEGEIPEECSDKVANKELPCSGVILQVDGLFRAPLTFLSLRGSLFTVSPRGAFWGDYGSDIESAQGILNLCNSNSELPDYLDDNIDSCKIIETDSGVPVAKVVKKRIGYADNTKFIDEDIRTSYFIYLNLNKVKGAITLSPRSLIEQGGISNAGLLMDELIKTIQVID